MRYILFLSESRIAKLLYFLVLLRYIHAIKDKQNFHDVSHGIYVESFKRPSSNKSRVPCFSVISRGYIVKKSFFFEKSGLNKGVRLNKGARLYKSLNFFENFHFVKAFSTCKFCCKLNITFSLNKVCQP